MLLVGAAVSLLPVFALSMFAFPSADDYCYAVAARNGFWHAQVSTYLGQGGRYTSTFLYTALGLGDLSKIYPWFCLTTLLSTLVSFRIFIGSLFKEHMPNFQLWVAAGVAMSVFVGKIPSQVEAFFWMAGTINYLWPIIAFLIWMALLIRIARDADSGGAKSAIRIIATILTILLPGFNEIFCPIILLTLAFSATACRWNRHEAGRFVLALLGIAILLCAVMAMAPGNAVRSAAFPFHPTRHNLGFSLLESARKSWRFFVGHWSYLSLWAAAVSAWLWGPRSIPKTKTVFKSTASIVLWTCVAAAGVYATLLPLYWEYGSTNYSGEGRTYIIPYFIFCIAMVATGTAILTKISEHLSGLSCWIRANRRLMELLVAGIFSVLIMNSPATRTAAKALKAAPAYLKAQRDREAILKSPENKANAVILDTMALRPLPLYWGDIRPEADHWINRCMASYYGLSSLCSPSEPQKLQESSPRTNVKER